MQGQGDNFDEGQDQGRVTQKAVPSLHGRLWGSRRRRVSCLPRRRQSRTPLLEPSDGSVAWARYTSLAKAARKGLRTCEGLARRLACADVRCAHHNNIRDNVSNWQPRRTNSCANDNVRGSSLRSSLVSCQLEFRWPKKEGPVSEDVGSRVAGAARTPVTWYTIRLLVYTTLEKACRMSSSLTAPAW